MTEIVVDSSAIFAIILGEPEAEDFHRELIAAQPIMSAATRVEIAHASLRRFGAVGVEEVEALLADYEIRTVPLDKKQSEEAIRALLSYGKGRGAAPAVLNMGDAFSYALAKVKNLPLLYKGDDFARTDIPSVL